MIMKSSLLEGRMPSKFVLWTDKLLSPLYMATIAGHHKLALRYTYLGQWSQTNRTIGILIGVEIPDPGILKAYTTS